MAAEGLSNAAIAERMHIAEKSVEMHMGRIYTELNLEPTPLQNRRVVAVRMWLDANPDGQAQT